MLPLLIAGAAAGIGSGILGANAAKAAQKKAEMLASLLEEHLGKPVLSGRRSKPLDTLIATLLSQNTNDLNSHRAWLNLKRTFPTWGQVLDAPTKKIAKAIEVGGLKNQKARRIKRILEVVRADTGDFDLAFLRGRTNEEVIDYLTSLKVWVPKPRPAYWCSHLAEMSFRSTRISIDCATGSDWSRRRRRNIRFPGCNRSCRWDKPTPFIST